MNTTTINRSKRVTDAQVAQMVAGVAWQLAQHVAPDWERLPPGIVFLPGGPAPPPPAPILEILDDPDDPSALGDHDEAAGGQPTGRIFASPVLDAGGGILDAGTAGASVSSVLSHEALEQWFDPDVNDWLDGPSIAEGSCYAAELCDPVESDSYVITPPGVGPPVLVSNYIRPAFFDPFAPASASRDRMGTTPRSFAVAPGGYLLVRGAPGSEKQVLHTEQRPAAWREAHRHHPARRLARRLEHTGSLLRTAAREIPPDHLGTFLFYPPRPVRFLSLMILRAADRAALRISSMPSAGQPGGPTVPFLIDIRNTGPISQHCEVGVRVTRA